MTLLGYRLGSPELGPAGSRIPVRFFPGGNLRLLGEHHQCRIVLAGERPKRVSSFHSLEDRIVKHTFRALSGKDNPALVVLTKKPQVPDREESDRNTPSRSAKLR